MGQVGEESEAAHPDVEGWERALVEKAVEGDDDALAVLLTDSRGRLRDRVAKRVPRALQRLISADDIVQQAHMDVFGAVRSFEARGPDSFYRWMSTIAAHRLSKEIRRYHAAKRAGDRRRVEGGRHFGESSFVLMDTLAGPGKTPSRTVARREAVEAVEEALADLPERHRNAVRLVHIEGKSALDAAQAMGCTRRAVHGLCGRGLKRMQQRLGRG